MGKKTFKKGDVCRLITRAMTWSEIDCVEHVRVVDRVRIGPIDAVDVVVLDGVFRGIHVWASPKELEKLPAFKRPKKERRWKSCT